MQELFKKYLDNQCSAEEVRLLLNEFEAGENEDFLKSLISQQLQSEQENSFHTDKEFENALAIAYSNIQKEIAVGKKFQPTPVVQITKHRWFRVAAAAILILIAAATYLLLNKNNEVQPIAGNQKPAVNDIAPGGNKAVLTLADGSTIILDNAANGTITKQGNTKVLKLDNGQLAYNSLNEKPTEVLYNTITTPRGGQYQLTLSDGSKVWLNAASSLRYPANFVGKERKVELTGEGYFEVAKNASMPFKVDVAGKEEVEVLGTHFNINSYEDESLIKTTLAEGSVKVSHGITTVKLVPSQQARFSKADNNLITINANVDKELAWVNGLFDFENDNISDIMRQLSRWYDVEINYSDKIEKHYTGSINRLVNISKVLQMFEAAGGVKFVVEGEGKKITVKSK